MAQSLGVSQIYMGFVLTAIRHEGKDTLAKTLGIDGKIQAIMALGIPAFKYPKYTDRKEIVKNYIEWDLMETTLSTGVCDPLDYAS